LTVSGNVIAGSDVDGGGDSDVLTVATLNGSTVVPGATITLPSGAHLVMQANGSYSYDPNGVFAALTAVQTAVDTFTYTISDGQGGTASATATIIIQGQNDNPLAVTDLNTTRPQVAITVSAAVGVLQNDTDAEHDVLTVTTISNGVTSVAAGSPIGGSNGGSFVINADGSYSFALAPAPPSVTRSAMALAAHRPPR
jgi:VCBS repeat-containing protein